MYIQLTERCNMTCAHCCFAATTEGTLMSRETFVAAVRMAENNGEYITIGGGEPTLHPLLFDFLGIAMAADVEGVFLVTNGKKQAAALRLARMARTGKLGVSLSLDEFHDPVSQEVVDAFSVEKSRAYRHYESTHEDLRSIRSARSDRIINVGRAKDNNMGTAVGVSCACDDLLVAPDGALYACGCKTMAFGTVFEPNIPEDFCSGDEYAHRSIEYPMAQAA